VLLQLSLSRLPHRGNGNPSESSATTIATS
jgi:hypothetical protein